MSTNAIYNPGLAELGRKNQPNGYVGINDDGEVVGSFAQRRDTAANIAAMLLKNGELAFTTDTQETFIGDGVTVGGKFLYQVPQIKKHTFAGGLPVADLPNANDTNSIVIPKILGATYRIAMKVFFDQDTNNESNFALRIYCNSVLDSSTHAESYTEFIRHVWHSTGGPLIADLMGNVSLTTGPASFGAGFMLASPNLNLSSAICTAEATVTPNKTLTSTYPYFVIQPSYRVGGTSPATAYTSVIHQRIA